MIKYLNLGNDNEIMGQFDMFDHAVVVTPALGDTITLGARTFQVVHRRFLYGTREGLLSLDHVIVCLREQAKIKVGTPRRDGYYNKYIVTKADGTPIDPDADYFVLRIDADKAAQQAAKVYTDAVESTLPRLANDLRARLRAHRKKD